MPQPRDNHQATHVPTFKGNKASLPSKPCVACGRAMVWRKRWAKNWDAVKFCSDACRQRGAAKGPADA